MSDIKLNLINKTGADCPGDIVIFRENLAAGPGDLPVAWRVIEDLKKDASHPFIYPMELGVTTTDSWGNYTPMLPAEGGQLFQVVTTQAGILMEYAGRARSSLSIEVLNALQVGSINALIYADGRAIAVKTSVAPGQKAVFEFKPTIWIGVVSQMQEGDVMNSAIIAQVNTELALTGITEADIIMTGGGPGPNSMPFAFNLDNIIPA